MRTGHLRHVQNSVRATNLPGRTGGMWDFVHLQNQVRVLARGPGDPIRNRGVHMSEPSPMRRQPVRWEPVLSGEARAAAIDLCRDIGTRLASPERVIEATAMTLKQTAYPEYSRWVPYSLAEGDAGLAILSGYLEQCYPGQGWDIVAHHQVAAAAQAIERTGWPAPGLFEGLSGFAFSARTLSRAGARYQRLLMRIDQKLLTNVDLQVSHLLAAEHGMEVGAFDAISGLAGIGAYLLTRAEHTDDYAPLEQVVSALITIADDTNPLPRWFTPPNLLADPDLAASQPYGVLNCGLAHGIPGPLALMSLARTSGLETKGLDEAIEHLANWLIAQTLHGEWGPMWPSIIPLNSGGQSAGTEPSRTAWCYGSPGVARAIWLAGRALDDTRICNAAIEAMEAVYRTPIPARGIDSPNLCHGIGGLLLITMRFAHDTEESLFASAAQLLAAQILAAYEPESVVALRDVEPDGRRVDRPGLLTGASGVAAVLLAAASDVEPAWDRSFLIA
jgi:lantibiotic modifying enzyme